MITGMSGSLGTALAAKIDAVGFEGDIRDPSTVAHNMNKHRPDLIYHLAAAKHAPEGEVDPLMVTETNVRGTANILAAAASDLHAGTKVVVASTCKAADPETVYGASKLIAERLTLNAGQVIARFYNVPETCGNVFELWRNLPEDEPIPWTDCWRYFISSREAVNLLLKCADLPSGRYTVWPGESQHMRDVAALEYPDRRYVQVPRRIGDRYREPLHAASETTRLLGDGLYAIESAWHRELVAA